MEIKDIIAPIEEFAPLALQEAYDNSGLLAGEPETEITSALVCVDVTEEVIDEAIALGAGLVISHHPVIFHPLRSINSQSNVGNVVIKAIRNNIAIYAAHTNLDRARHGMSYVLAKQLGLNDITVLDTEDNGTGFGAIGTLTAPLPALEFLRQVRQKLNIGCIRHSAPPKKTIQKVALITGSGGEGLEKAIEQNADVFLSADLRHDRFLAATGRILLADVGHWESEFCAIDLICDVISKKITNFALHKSANSRNPVSYLS